MKNCRPSMKGSRIAVWVAIGGVAFLLAAIALQAGAEPAARAEPREYTFLSWNVEWYPGKSRFARSPQRRTHKSVVESELARLKPDVFLAQEMRGWEAFADLCAVVPGLNPVVVSAFRSPYSGEYWQQQIGIASVLPAFAAWSEPWVRGNEFEVVRGFSVAALRIPGSYHLLLVYSVHLKSNLARSEEHVQLNYRIRDESIRQLLAHIREMEDVAFPDRILGVVVGGDFNTNHDDQFADNVVALMEAAGFYNTWRDIPPPERATWRGSERFDPSTLDYFFTKGLGTPRAVLLEVADETSDHWPVQLVIMLPEPPNRRPESPSPER